MMLIWAMIIFTITKSLAILKQTSTLPKVNEIDRVCPTYSSQNLIKNGSIHNGKPKHQCQACGRQFVENSNNIVDTTEAKRLIDKLLFERISLRRIDRFVGGGWDWLRNYLNKKMNDIPRNIKISSKQKGGLMIECDEMRSFVAIK